MIRVSIDRMDRKKPRLLLSIGDYRFHLSKKEVKRLVMRLYKVYKKIWGVGVSYSGGAR